MSEHSGPVIAERDGLKVRQCSACGFAHLDPLPDTQAVNDYYAKDFWSEKGKGWLAKYEAEREWNSMRHGDWLSVLGPHTVGRDLLDVGSGYGFCLADAREQGWRATGIEPSQEANKYSTERFLLTAHLGTWENFDHPYLPKHKFDAITAFWLLEHLPEPMRFLRWCRSHLHSGGVLSVSIPNEWNALQTVANINGKCLPNFWIHPTHCNYWTPATLSNLLGRCGFRVVDSLSTWPIEEYLLDGRDYTRDESVGAQCHAEVRAKELVLTREQRFAQGRAHARQALGRDLIVVAVPED